MVQISTESWHLPPPLAGASSPLAGMDNTAVMSFPADASAAARAPQTARRIPPFLRREINYLYPARLRPSPSSFVLVRFRFGLFIETP